jgi:hypothetical protein
MRPFMWLIVRRGPTATRKQQLRNLLRAVAEVVILLQSIYDVAIASSTPKLRAG